MVKRIVLGMVGLLFVLSVAGFAAESRITDSVGYDVNYNALSFKKIKDDNRTLQLLFGAFYESQRTGDSKALLNLTLAFRSRTKMISAKNFRVDSYWGLGIVKNDSHVTNVGQTNFYGELGAAPELFVTDNLSIELALGVKLAILGESFSGAGDSCTQVQTFGSGVNFAPGLSCNYYFGK